MKIIEISLGGKTYEIHQLPVGRARQWREQFAEPIEQLVGSLEHAGDLIGADLGSGQDIGLMIKSIGQVLLGGIGKTLLSSMDMLLDMLYAYAPTLKVDKDFIEENAYDDEVAAAFVEVLKLAYPFSQAIGVIRGQLPTQTRKNSR